MIPPLQGFLFGIGLFLFIAAPYIFGWGSAARGK